MPPGGAWDDIDDEVKKIVLAHWDMLQEAWNKKYPSNPITSTEEDDDKDS